MSVTLPILMEYSTFFPKETPESGLFTNQTFEHLAMVENSLCLFLPIPLCDIHIHTRFCGHATGEMEEYVQAAIQKKLKKIIFLEHMEEGIRYFQGKTWLSEDDFDAYFAEGQRLRSTYAAEIEIGLGVECGYNPDC